MNSRAVVLTGLGAVSPFGVGSGPLCAGLARGVPPFRPMDRFETSAGSGVLAGLVTGFVASDYADSQRIRRLDPLSSMAIACAKLAVVDAGLTHASEHTRASRVGVVFGASLGCQDTTVRYARKLVEDGPGQTNPIDFPDSIDGAPAAHVAMELELRGPNTTLMDDGVAGESALAQAVLAIECGAADRVFVGAGDVLSPTAHAVMHQLGLLCPADQLMRPYDGQRCGWVPGEGMGMIVLECAELAERRGARIYARLGGVGHGCAVRGDAAGGIGVGSAAAESMRVAVRRAGLGADVVDLFSGSAAALRGLDDVELAAASRVFPNRHTGLCALRGLWGAFAADGILRLVAETLALHTGIMPSVPGLETPEPATHLRWSARPAAARLRSVVHHTQARAGQAMTIVLLAP